MIIGYARVSTAEQNLDRELDALKAYGVERIFEEKITGTTLNRPQFNKMMLTLREGDTLVIESFSRLSRSTKDLLETVEKLNQMGVDIVSLKEKLDTTTATGKLMLSMISSISQFERDIIAERTREGLKASRARGRMGGRPKAGTEEEKRKALALYKANAMSNREIANIAGVSTATLSRWIKEMKMEEK